MNWPEQIRKHLAASRQARVPFELAWRSALRTHPVPDPVWSDGADSPLVFMERHMGSAYNRDGSGLGRLRVPALVAGEGVAGVEVGRLVA